MEKPTEWNPTEIDVWREKIELTRLRRDIMGMESYGRDIAELRRNERW